MVMNIWNTRKWLIEHDIPQNNSFFEDDVKNAWKKKQCSQMKIPTTGTLGILKTSVLDGYLKLDQADKILSKMTDAGFYSPLRSIVDII